MPLALEDRPRREQAKSILDLLAAGRVLEPEIILMDQPAMERFGSDRIVLEVAIDRNGRIAFVAVVPELGAQGLLVQLLALRFGFLVFVLWRVGVAAPLLLGLEGNEVVTLTVSNSFSAWKKIFRRGRGGPMSSRSRSSTSS